MKRLAIFDLDGTLIDTIEDLGAAVNHALELRGLPLHTVDEYRRMVGHGVRNLVTQALPGDWHENEAFIDGCLADFKAYYSSHIDVHTRPYPGMVELLNELSAKGMLLAVASNKFQAGTEHLIREFFPSVNFVAILGNRDGFPLKPSPEIVDEILSRARENITKTDAVFIGDSPTDMRTAANSGIDGIAVTWGYRTEAELAPLVPINHLVRSVSELRATIL